MIYVASPYAHEDLEIMEIRVEQVTEYTASLLARGKVAYSPICHGHQVQKYLPENLRIDHSFWLRLDAGFLVKSDELHVLCLEGWEDSKGVAWEIATAKAFGMDIKYIPLRRRNG